MREQEGRKRLALSRKGTPLRCLFKTFLVVRHAAVTSPFGVSLICTGTRIFSWRWLLLLPIYNSPAPPVRSRYLMASSTGTNNHPANTDAGAGDDVHGVHLHVCSLAAIRHLSRPGGSLLDSGFRVWRRSARFGARASSLARGIPAALYEASQRLRRNSGWVTGLVL